MKHGGNVWNGGRPEHWLDFSANLRPEGTPEWVMSTMQEALKDTRYYPDRSMKSARAGLAKYLGMDEACVLPTAGGAAAIDLVLSLKSGSVHVHQPTFGEYAERAAAHGRKVSHAESVDAGDTVVLCNPNNPTGTIVPPQEMLALHHQIVQAGGELMVDEAFMDYCPQHTVRHAVTEGLTVVGSFTKILCIPGVRLGYVCAVPEQIAAMEERAVTWSLNTLASAVAARLPDHLPEILEDARLSQERAERFAHRLRECGMKTKASAVPFLLVDFGRDMTQAVARLRERHILVRTCGSFGLSPNVLRLAVKTDQENEILLEALCSEC